MKLHGLVALFPLALAAPVGAQFATDSPSYQVGVVATGVAAYGSSMAVDRFGNAFVVDRDPTAAGPYSVTRIAPDGTVTPSFASGLFAPGEAAYDPTDGLVYVVDVVSPAPAPGSNVLRLDPNVGPVVVGSVNVAALGFAIDDNGRMYFGGDGAQGPGLYHVDAPLALGPNLATFDATGFGTPGVLETLRSGDVLIAVGGDDVVRYEPASGNVVDWYRPLFSVGNQWDVTRSIARSPFNQLGLGAIIGVNSVATICFCGNGVAFFGGPLGELGPAGVTFFGSEFYLASQTSNGLRALASGQRRDLYWYTSDATLGPQNVLLRVTEIPTAGATGTMLVQGGPAALGAQVFGPAGAPVLLGVMLPFVANPEGFFPPYGVLDLDVTSPFWLPLLDGIGYSGPPSPAGVIPASGELLVGSVIPPGLSGLTFDFQTLIASPNAPNGVLYLTNVASFTVP